MITLVLSISFLKVGETSSSIIFASLMGAGDVILRELLILLIKDPVADIGFVMYIFSLLDFSFAVSSTIMTESSSLLELISSAEGS